jgi:predicted short-subunit dehydrogenase-like oxidoreductase (DUF2520 family)
MLKPSFVLIGCGKVGSALACLLQEKNYPLVGVASKSLASAQRLAEKLNCQAANKPEKITPQAELVFITTPDREIAQVAQRVAKKGGFHRGQVVIHTSGVCEAGELRGVREAGAFAASMHPIQAVADVETALKNLPGSYFALEGDTEALPVVTTLVSDLGGRFFFIQAKDKALYHTAACVISNYLVGLAHFSTGLYQSFGLSRKEAFQALLPLIRGTLDNIEQNGPILALTGPVDRDDEETIKSHLNALTQKVTQEEINLYCALGLYIISIAREKGSLNAEQAARLQTIFTTGRIQPRILERLKIK